MSESNTEYSQEEKKVTVNVEVNGVDDFISSDPAYKGLVNRKKYKKPQVNIGPWNNLTEQDYKKKGLTSKYPLNWQEHWFLATANPKYDFERTVTKIIKVNAPDFDDPKKRLKEFVYYYENWYGRDFIGKKVEVGDHVEGLYKEQLLEGVIYQDQQVGERRAGERVRYTIPFSKKAVDDIIKNSMCSDRDSIIFTVKHKHGRTEVTYDQFVMPLEELQKFWDRRNNRQYVMHEANPQYS